MSEQRFTGEEIQVQLSLKLVERLRLSERKYKDLVQNLKQVVFQIDLDGRFVFLNEAWQTITGLEIEKTIDMPWLDFIYKADIPLAEHHFQLCNSKENTGGEKTHIECRLDVNGSELIDVELSLTPLFGFEGLEGLIGTFSDISDYKKALMELAVSKDRIDQALAGAEDGYWDWDLDSDYVYYSPRWKSMLGYQENEDFDSDFTTWASLVNPQDKDHVIELVELYLAGESDKFEAEFRMLHKDGSWVDILSRALLARDEQGKELSPRRLVGTHVDISERNRTQLQLQLQNIALEAATHAIVMTDPNAIVEWVNPAFTELTGYQADEVYGTDQSTLIYTGLENDVFYRDLMATVSSGSVWKGDLRNKTKKGVIYDEYMTVTPVSDEQGHIHHYVVVKEDITQRKVSEKEIEALAFYDPLTRLPNRRLFFERLKQSLMSSERDGEYHALLFIDLDNFKTLNDNYGHDIGDLLLIDVAQLISACVRNVDTVARFGGDEFVVILEQLGENFDQALISASNIAEKILKQLNDKHQLLNIQYQGSSSIGICVFLDEYAKADEILKRADIAMYEAKSAGRNTLRFFDPIMQSELEQRTQTEKELWKAINQQQFKLFYQMLIDDNQKVIGVEALLRWQHPEKGILGPDAFLALIEINGMIITIGDWVIKEGLYQLREWQKAGYGQLTLSLNISAVQFQKENFVEKLHYAVEQSGVDCRSIYLELTESTLISDIDSTIQKIRELNKMGIKFAMDDFGTGYSSLSYLKRFDLDQLKIDRLFVSDILTNQDDLVLVTTIINMGRNLGLDVVAEGIEQRQQFEVLKKAGCMKFQGYWIDRPMPADKLNLQPRVD